MFAAWGLGAVVHFNAYFGEGTAWFHLLGQYAVSWQ